MELIKHLEICLEQFKDLKTSPNAAKSAHVTHQPGFITHAEKVNFYKLLDSTWIIRFNTYS
jgi:hypothetical protein